MKKTVTITTPARPAKTEEVQVYSCDCCDKNETRSRVMRQCVMCGRCTCGSCSQNDPFDGGDYPGMFCKYCMAVYPKYHPMRQDEDRRHYKEMDRINAAWKAESLKTEAKS